MDHRELVELIREGIVPGNWAEFGSGAGAFTMALADLLGPEGGRIISVDRDAGALRRQREAMERHFPTADVDYVHADFTRDLDMPPLTGVLMANSLHFVRRKEPLLARLWRTLEPGGRLVLVEYDADRGNPWVPHPLSYPTWERVAAEAGFIGTRRLGLRPSRHFGGIYSAVSWRPLLSEHGQSNVHCN